MAVATERRTRRSTDRGRARRAVRPPPPLAAGPAAPPPLDRGGARVPPGGEGGGAWAVRVVAAEPVAFDRRCPHLGCPVLWAAERGRFECPCHHAAFDARTGEV